VELVDFGEWADAFAGVEGPACPNAASLCNEKQHQVPFTGAQGRLSTFFCFALLSIRSPGITSEDRTPRNRTCLQIISGFLLLFNRVGSIPRAEMEGNLAYPHPPTTVEPHFPAWKTT
jgi:hypothetical protein